MLKFWVLNCTCYMCVVVAQQINTNERKNSLNSSVIPVLVISSAISEMYKKSLTFKIFLMLLAVVRETRTRIK